MTDTSQPTLAIVGATGAVGCECRELLAERGVEFAALRLFASSRSAGKVVPCGDETIEIEALAEGCFRGVDVAIFCASGAVSGEWSPRAVAEGAYVVDNSSAFRMEDGVPLIVPEINGDVLNGCDQPCIIANPNCSTIIALMAVTPLHRAVRVARMVVSTYQAASGAGAAAMAELEQQAHDHAAGRDYRMEVFDRPYLFNLFSHDSPIGPDGYNLEETKLRRETHKIWDDDSIAITATCVRVPVLRAHSEAINLTFAGEMTEARARELLSAAPGVVLVDDREANQFPEPRLASGRDEVLVGRIRADLSQPEGQGLDLFVAGDQLRKGAALNAVQIVERVVEMRSPKTARC